MQTQSDVTFWMTDVLLLWCCALLCVTRAVCCCKTTLQCHQLARTKQRRWCAKSSKHGAEDEGFVLQICIAKWKVPLLSSTIKWSSTQNGVWQQQVDEVNVIRLNRSSVFSGIKQSDVVTVFCAARNLCVLCLADSMLWSQQAYCQAWACLFQLLHQTCSFLSDFTACLMRVQQLEWLVVSFLCILPIQSSSLFLCFLTFQIECCQCCVDFQCFTQCTCSTCTNAIIDCFAFVQQDVLDCFNPSRPIHSSITFLLVFAHISV